MNQLVMSEVERDKEIGQHQKGPQRYALVVKDCVFSDATLLETFCTSKEVVFAVSTAVDFVCDYVTLFTLIGLVKYTMFLQKVNLHFRSSYLLMKLDDIEGTHVIL